MHWKHIELLGADEFRLGGLEKVVASLFLRTLSVRAHFVLQASEMTTNITIAIVK